jgi:hypothetical protein
VRLPIGTLALDDELRRAVRAAPGPAGREIIVGMRPEHFKDAALVSPEQHGGATFTAKRLPRRPLYGFTITCPVTPTISNRDHPIRGPCCGP